VHRSAVFFNTWIGEFSWFLSFAATVTGVVPRWWTAFEFWRIWVARGWLALLHAAFQRKISPVFLLFFKIFAEFRLSRKKKHRREVYFAALLLGTPRGRL